MVAASIKVMVVADDPDERSDLAALMSAEPGCLVIGAHASGEDLPTTGGALPDVIVWDLGADPDAGLARMADAEELQVPIVALVQDDRDGIPALAHGAAGVLAGPADPERIVLAARAVLGGLVAVDPAIVADVAAGAHQDAVDDDAPVEDDAPGGRPSIEDAPFEALTRREHDVLRLMAEGLGNKQIAERLGITEHTAKFHVHTILGKLGTRSRTEAVVYAARLGLIAI
jgi:DNA-binding NarL/FixJ family response regulator